MTSNSNESDADLHPTTYGPSGSEPPQPEPPEPLPIFFLRRLGRALVARYMVLVSLIPLLMGATLLMGSWRLYEQRRDRRQTLEAFTGRATGTLERPWVRLDVDPALGPHPRYWFEQQAAADFCARLRFTPADGHALTTVFCRPHSGIGAGAQLLTWENILGRAMPLPWVDGRGMPEVRLALSARTADWASEGGLLPLWPQGGDTAPAPALEELWREVDDPFFYMLREWSNTEPEYDVAYRPDDPRQALPVAVVTSESMYPSEQRIPEIVFICLFAAFGAAAWWAGCYLVTWGAGRWWRAGLFLGTLLLLPWWSDYLGRPLGWIWRPASEILIDLKRDFLGIQPPPEIKPPGYSGEPGDVHLVWHLGVSPYAPVLATVPLEPPSRRLGDNALLAALCDQVEARLLALPDESRAAVLRQVAEIQDREGQGEELGLLFLEPAAEICGDESRGDALRSAACHLLDTLRWNRPSDNPYRLAARERARLLRLVPGTP